MCPMFAQQYTMDINSEKSFGRIVCIPNTTRWYEEDPETKNMIIISSNSAIAGCDSRFEYDLNRSPEDAFLKLLGENSFGKPASRRI